MDKDALLRSCFAILVATSVSGCTDHLDGTGFPKADLDKVDLSEAERVDLWSTHYYLLNASSSDDGVPMRNMQDIVIGPKLSELTWCDAAVQGSVRVDGVTFTYAGKRENQPPQADCKLDTSETVRWKTTRNRFGTGSNSNALIPFKTIACDLGTMPDSEPWTSNGFPKFGQRVFIPDAVGTVLPDGSQHDGIFVCGDVGRAITGNHIDVFIGDALGRRDALARNPFSFVEHRPSRRFSAFLID